MKQIYLFLSFVLLLGCSAPKRTTPHFEIPASFAHIGLIDSVSLGNVSWQSFFEEAQLRMLIEQSLENNFDLRLAVTRCELAAQTVKQANVNWLPNAQLQASASSDNSNPNRFNAGGKLQWEIDLWAKTKDRIVAARVGYELSQEELKTVRTAVVAQTASLFYTIHWLDRQLLTLDRQQALNDTLVAMQTTLYRLGKAPSTTVEQMRAQGKDLEIARSNTDKLKENALHALTALQGKTTMEWTVQRQVGPLVVPQLAIGVPAKLLGNRPDLRAAERALVIANAEINIARKEFYPSIVINGSGGWSSDALSKLFSNGILGVIDGSLVQPIFNRRQIKTAYEQAKIRKQQADISFEKCFVQAFAEVDDALLSLARLRDQRRLAGERLNLLEKALEDSRRLYNAGRTTYPELLLIQRDQLDALLQCIELDKEHQLAFIELYRALGGGV